MTVTQAHRDAAHHMRMRLALLYVKDFKRARAAYEAEVDAWYRSGEGRSPNWRTEVDSEGHVYQWNAGGHGYRFPYCIHGTSLWTDYDNICGPCEDGYSVYQLALIRAHDTYDSWMNRMSVVQYAKDQKVPDDIVIQLITWASEALPEEWRK